MKILTSEEGMVLILVLLVSVVAAIYLSSYAIWTIWDQKNLLRQGNAEQADKIARAGLNRATQDLYMDTDSWLDGNINGNSVTPPDGGNPDTFTALYSETLENGSYTVEIDYLQNPKTCISGCSFYDKRMLIRVTATVQGAERRLEQIVNAYRVKNITQELFYANLQPAINEADDNDNIGITAAILNENVSISSAQRFNVKGCYDDKFSRRSCSSYDTLIRGNLTINGNANVNLSGVTIE